jgi:hypothetical protein
VQLCGQHDVLESGLFHKKRKPMKKLFLLTFLSFVFAAHLSAQWGSGIKGKGPIVEKELNLSSFDAIKLKISGDVFLKQGPQRVMVKGQQNIIDNIETDVSDNVWEIEFDERVRKYDGLKIYIMVPDLSSINVSGSGDIEGKSKFTGLNDLYIAVSGSGNIKLDFEAEKVETKISGSGDLDLNGSADSFSASISGSGDINAIGLEVDDAQVRISGSGDCSIHAKEALQVKISGSGDVDYKGRPRINSKVSGSGDLNARS